MYYGQLRLSVFLYKNTTLTNRPAYVQQGGKDSVVNDDSMRCIL